MDTIEVIETPEASIQKRRPGRPKKVQTDETPVGAPIDIGVTDEENTKLLALIDLVKEVGTTLGKGYVEGVYQQAICVELQKRGILYTSEEPMPILYNDVVIGYHTKRLDILLRSYLPFIIELKAVSALTTTSIWQIMRYLNYKNCRMGAVVNYSQSARGGIGIKIIIKNNNKYYLYNPQTRLGEEVASCDYKIDYSAKIEDDAEA